MMKFFFLAIVSTPSGYLTVSIFSIPSIARLASMPSARNRATFLSDPSAAKAAIV